MAKKQKPSSEELLRELIKIHVPQAYLAHFDLVEVKDKPDCYELVQHHSPHHVGESMFIDEKMINGKYCAILSNHQIM